MCFFVSYISHEMHNLFVINLKKDKHTAYQVNRPSSFYGFLRPIEFDWYTFYGLTLVIPKHF